MESINKSGCYDDISFDVGAGDCDGTGRGCGHSDGGGFKGGIGFGHGESDGSGEDSYESPDNSDINIPCFFGDGAGSTCGSGNLIGGGNG